jgi:arylsulfatase A-like enzyme
MKTFRTLFVLILVVAVAIAGSLAWKAFQRPRHNVVIFVADGLRSHIVTPQTAPNMAAIRAGGVDLANSHSIYPTFTTPNASVIATGHKLGDTGDFGNILYVGQPTSSGSPSPFAGVEDDEVLGGLNRLYHDNYLDETSLMAAARRAGYQTAAIGKLGPVGIQDVTSRDGKGSLIIDDSTGSASGIPLPADVVQAIKAAGLPAVAEDRGLNASPGAYNAPGVWVANVQQQDWFTAVATKVLLPRFKARAKPFFMVFWSRDPDGTQHNQGDSLNSLTPGINGPTTIAAIRNADNDLGRLQQALREQGLADSTDIVVIADHGFSVINKQSATSASARVDYADVPHGFLPPGFLAADMARALNLPMADGGRVPVDLAHEHSHTGDALLGPDPAHPQVAIAANGGSDLIYLPGDPAKGLAKRIVAWLTTQDYVGAIFVKDSLGRLPGALPESVIGLHGHARTPQPDLVVSFASHPTGCPDPEVCAAEVADTTLQQGQGMHGTFSRADTHNFMAAIGPDFRQGFRDAAPVGNVDVAPTLARVMALHWRAIGHLQGRVMSEALKGGAGVTSRRYVLESDPAANGFTTVLEGQRAGGTDYYDAAGAPGRVVGLRE